MADEYVLVMPRLSRQSFERRWNRHKNCAKTNADLMNMVRRYAYEAAPNNLAGVATDNPQTF